MFSLLAALILGFQHAFELDHLAAIASFSSSSLSTGLRSALKWVAGHVAVILAATVVAFSLFRGLTVQTSAFEPVVGIVLIALAVNKLRHLHHGSKSLHAGKLGMLHGLSGTGAFVALAFAAAASIGDVFVFSALFGIGLAVGAVVAAVLFVAPFASVFRFHKKALNLSYAVFTGVAGLTLVL